MAEQRSDKTERSTSSTSGGSSGGGGKDDEQRRDTRRRRNNELPAAPEFTGDVETLRAQGIPEQLLKGNDPDARLTD